MKDEGGVGVGGGAGELFCARHHFTAPNTDKNRMDSVICHFPERGKGVGAVMEFLTWIVNCPNIRRRLPAASPG